MLWYDHLYFDKIKVLETESLWSPFISRKKIEFNFGSSPRVPAARLFKSIQFGNGSSISDEKHAILEFKYLQNKKW